MAASPTLQVLLNMLWVFIFGWISGAIVGVAPGGDPRPRAGELSTKLGGGSLRLYSQPPFVFAFAFVFAFVCVFVVFVFHPFISISLSFGLVMTWRWIRNLRNKLKTCLSSSTEEEICGTPSIYRAPCTNRTFAICHDIFVAMMLTFALAMIIWCLGFVFVFVVFVMTMIIWCLGLPDRREHGRVESKSHNWVDLLSPPCLFVIIFSIIIIIIINQKNINTILIIIIRLHNDDHLFWAVLSLNCVFRDDLKVKSDF